MQKSCKVYAWDVTCYKLQQKMFIQVQQVNFHNHWSLFYKDVHQCGITTSVMNGATGAQGTRSFCIAPSDWRWVGITVTGRQQPSSWGRHLGGPSRGFLNRVKLWWFISVALVNFNKLLKISQSGLLPKTPFFCQPLSLLLLSSFASDYFCSFPHSWHLVRGVDYSPWPHRWCLVGDVLKLTFLPRLCLLHYSLWWPSKHTDELPHDRFCDACACRNEQTGACILLYYIIIY